jgi:hypothetical protein
MSRLAAPPVNASPTPLRMHTHDSGPEWLARPSPYETLTHYLPSVLPTHPLITTSHRLRGGDEFGGSSHNSPSFLTDDLVDRPWADDEGNATHRSRTTPGQANSHRSVPKPNRDAACNRRCCVLRNMLQSTCDQVVPAQGASEVLRNRQQSRNSTWSRGEAENAAGRPGNRHVH